MEFELRVAGVGGGGGVAAGGFGGPGAGGGGYVGVAVWGCGEGEGGLGVRGEGEGVFGEGEVLVRDDDGVARFGGEGELGEGLGGVDVGAAGEGVVAEVDALPAGVEDVEADEAVGVGRGRGGEDGAGAVVVLFGCEVSAQEYPDCAASVGLYGVLRVVDKTAWGRCRGNSPVEMVVLSICEQPRIPVEIEGVKVPHHLWVAHPECARICGYFRGSISICRDLLFRP